MTDPDARTINEILADAGAPLPEPKSRAPKAVRLVADISIFLFAISLAVIIGSAVIANLFSVPVFIEVALIALGVVLLLYYRHAKKWALLAIAAIYAVNVGIWLFSIAKGAPPDFAGFAISSVVPILLLGVGATHWPSFK